MPFYQAAKKATEEMTKTKTKHTPAPWTLRPNCWIMANGDSIATVATAGNNTGYDYHTTGETLANARLIATAPELLEALEKAVNRQGFTNEELILARAAIAKAKGAV